MNFSYLCCIYWSNAIVDILKDMAESVEQPIKICCVGAGYVVC